MSRITFKSKFGQRPITLKTKHTNWNFASSLARPALLFMRKTDVLCIDNIKKSAFLLKVPNQWELMGSPESMRGVIFSGLYFWPLGIFFLIWRPPGWRPGAAPPPLGKFPCTPMILIIFDDYDWPCIYCLVPSTYNICRGLALGLTKSLDIERASF